MATLNYGNLGANTPPLEQWGLIGSELGLQQAAVRGKILIVDASDANRRSVRSALGESDHEWIETRATSEAIAAISLHRVDLVLIDLLVPELGAVEFCRMLKKATATQFLPVFVMAPSDDPDAEVLAIEAGADEFLITPLRPAAFRARVQASLKRKAMIDSLDDSETVLFSLAQSVEERDPGLGQHCQRLALMGATMGVTLGLPAPDILALQRGGYLHDVGKVAIPDHVLFKPGPLTPEEWEVMKTHAERGERICSSMRSLTPVLPIIRHHHERWNGTGYPDGLKGEEIPLLARILQLADIYDALTTARPYKRALSPEEALEILEQEVQKGWRDPKLVATLSDILPMFHTPTPPDFAPLSLHALAASIERFRKEAGHNKPNLLLPDPTNAHN
ncbi:MAG: HD domain-containing protein [Acidobacteriaceae bacterium]|nr:HD domain-containing protein [Acidobacteriaceae bacterium]MBV9296888.1 HD domain-containing protein [Acidobacteriaceae bacterium]MBV9766836.1 HD domain-containing protein [Acidobacteriaceae bacterium]